MLHWGSWRGMSVLIPSSFDKWYMPLQMEKDLQIFWKILIGKAALQGVVGGETWMQEMEIKSRGKWWRLGEMGASQDSDASSCCLASQSNWSPQPALVYGARSFNYCLYCQICLATLENVFFVRLSDTVSRVIESPHSLPPHDLSRFIWLVLRSVYKLYYTTAILYSVNKLSYATKIFCVPVAKTVFCILVVLRHYNVVHLLLDMCRKIYIFVPLQLPVCSNGLCPPDILMECIISDRPTKTIKSWRSPVQMTKWTKLLFYTVVTCIEWHGVYNLHQKRIFFLC